MQGGLVVYNNYRNNIEPTFICKNFPIQYEAINSFQPEVDLLLTTYKKYCMDPWIINN